MTVKRGGEVEEIYTGKVDSRYNPIRSEWIYKFVASIRIWFTCLVWLIQANHILRFSNLKGPIDCTLSVSMLWLFN